MVDTTAIIIPCKDGWEHTHACLEAIATTTSWAQDRTVQVVIVDNGSRDETMEVRSDLVVRNFMNQGFAVGCNQGVRALPQEPSYVVLLNNDTIPHDGWLEALLEPLATPGSPFVAAGSKLLNPDGSIQHSGTRLFMNDAGILTAENMQDDGPPRIVEAVCGAAMAVKYRTWARLGGLDEGYYNGYEDVDFCLRARAEGGLIAYTPDSVVTHIGGASGPERWAAVQQNIDRLHGRWANKTIKDRPPVVVPRGRSPRGRKRR